MLNLNFNKDNFSVRTYLNFEQDIASSQVSDPRARLYNLYVEGRNIWDVLTFKLGRQPLFNSVAGGIFDGINVDLKKGAYKLTGYYGANVPAYQKFEITKDWSDDYIIGGKFITNAIEDIDISLSYIKKNFKAQEYWASRLDENFNPIQVLIRNNSNQYEFANAQVSYNFKDYFTIDTRYDYDLNYKKTSKFEVTGTYTQLKDFRLSAYYNYRQPLIRYNSIFSVFDFGNTEEYELGADYMIASNIWTSLKFGNVKYRDDNSQRITAGLNTNYGTISYRKTLGYEGEMDAISLYTARTFFDGIFTPTVGLSYTSYILAKGEARHYLTTLLAGFNYRPIRILSFDLQGQYMDNKIYENNYRVFFKINYWFNTNF